MLLYLPSVCLIIPLFLTERLYILFCETFWSYFDLTVIDISAEL